MSSELQIDLSATLTEKISDFNMKFIVGKTGQDDFFEQFVVIFVKLKLTIVRRLIIYTYFLRTIEKRLTLFTMIA